MQMPVITPQGWQTHRVYFQIGIDGQRKAVNAVTVAEIEEMARRQQVMADYTITSPYGDDAALVIAAAPNVAKAIARGFNCWVGEPLSMAQLAGTESIPAAQLF